ncbi:MAG TPA: SDR family oxidoreductase [candidate division Zixibacteria bacterium]|nr:SDR family oxidoreductase [candidate division Zixibacteria bacterium]
MSENPNSRIRAKAVITGASSGIGAAYARRFAKDGYDLILVARREELLVKLCEELSREQGIIAEYMIVDLAKEDELKIVEEKIKDTDNLEILVNNAGFGGEKRVFYEIPIQNHINMVQVHNIAPLKLIHAVIPDMIKRGKGSIINVSSIASLAPSPIIMYSTTKNFLNYLSESLDFLLRRKGIKIQVLCPGFTLTDFHKRLGYEPDDPIYRRKFMIAEKVVEASLKSLKKGAIYCIPGFRNKLLVFFIRILPKRILIFAYRKMLLKRKKD